MPLLKFGILFAKCMGWSFFLTSVCFVIVSISFRDHQEMKKKKTYKRKTKKIKFTCLLFYLKSVESFLARLALLFIQKNILCPFAAMVEFIQLAHCGLQSPPCR